ncbi:MAG: P-II family nitrogen regulator [Candidatus Sericytochromatia bacterium]
MKLVIAVVRPEKLNDILAALFKADIRGVTITRVQGHGGEIERMESYRGLVVKMELSEKIRLELCLEDHQVDATIKVILNVARTGKVGDGKIFVQPVEQVYHIRSGEQTLYVQEAAR